MFSVEKAVIAKWLIILLEFFTANHIAATTIRGCHYSLDEGALLCGSNGKLYDLDTCSCVAIPLKVTANVIILNENKIADKAKINGQNFHEGELKSGIFVQSCLV